ncbi:MAG: hypothetical protein MJ061_01000 [Mailhella sp.]|nr:hypothetical protein [Mailhella sp.]
MKASLQLNIAYCPICPEYLAVSELPLVTEKGGRSTMGAPILLAWLNFFLDSPIEMGMQAENTESGAGIPVFVRRFRVLERLPYPTAL